MATVVTQRILGGQREELANELRRRVTGEVKFDPFSRVLYSTDASIYQMEPIGVVIPKNVEDVMAVVEVAKDNRVPILPRAGGTSLAGQTVNHAIVVDFSKYLNQIIEVNVEEKWARVQPGIVLDDLNRRLKRYGLMYAPDPTTSSRACVGGGVGNNTCGAHSVIYGKTLDHIKELDVILSDGNQAHFHPLEGWELESKLSGEGLESDIYRGVRRLAQENSAHISERYPNIMRRVSGYNLDEFMTDSSFNLTKMIVGSEGTLCTVTEVKINLVACPTMTSLSVVHFRDIFGASEAVKDILEHSPSSIEIMDQNVLERSRASTGLSSNLDFIEGNPGAMLVVEFYGETEPELQGKMDNLKADMSRKGHGYACVNLMDKSAQGSVWAVRKNGLGLLMSMHGDAKPLPFVEDTAVDPEKMGDFVRQFDEIVRNHSTEAAYYGHASVGCLHIRPVVSLKNQEGIDKMMSIANEISDLVKEFGGSLSGEHGDGIVRGVWNEKMFGPEIYRLFQELKGTFDPEGIMNPGKIIDCPPMDQNLRYGANYKATGLPSKLDFSIDTDFAGAVEMCNGMGACRKLDGSMCPSYIATRDEEHSTRGRANLLRAALSGTLPEGTMTSRRLYEAMDLCLECKGCKSECESGVDMAKLKYEFLDQYHQANGIPLRNRVFAHINKISKWGSRTAPFSNWMTGNPLGQLITQKLLGLHKNRQSPKFVRETFEKWFNRHANATRLPTTGTVVLLNDTYMNFNYPQIGKAAVALLEAAGFKVILSDTECCGRPMISKGLLDAAKTNAEANLDKLYGYVEQNIPVVGCEPSCLLTFKDEYPDLTRDAKAKQLADNSFMIDEFLVRLHKEGRLRLNWSSIQKKVLLQAHCHQKSAMGTATSVSALDLVPGYDVELIEAGCCGMAGSFGYEKEHYDLSMKIGGEALFPAILAKDEDWEIAVMGVSCRQQIEDGTGRKARHLVEILYDALG